MLVHHICKSCHRKHSILTKEKYLTMICSCGAKFECEVTHAISYLRDFKIRAERISIMGKGPSATAIQHLDLTICINDAIYLIGDHPAILARGDNGLHCKRIPPNITPIVPDFLSDVYPNAYIFDYVKDLKMPKRLCTVCYAIALAHYLGATEIVMYGFDALLHGDYSYIIKNDYNNMPLADQKPQLRLLPREMLEKCVITDGIISKALLTIIQS